MSKTIQQFKEVSFICYEEPTKDLFVNLGATEFAWIKHDKDLYDNDDLEHIPGETKKTHYHCYCKLRAKKTQNGIFNIINSLNSTQLSLISKVNNTSGVIRYLIHFDNPEKFQYSLEEVNTNMNLQVFFELETSDDNFVMEVLKLCENEEIKTFRQLTFLAISRGKLDLIMSKAYFFKSILKGD